MSLILILFVAYLVLGAVWLRGQTDPGVPDLGTRQSAQAWHNTWWPRTYGVPMGFTGDVAAGVPGTTSAAFQEASLLRYNIFRRMVGSQPYVLDAGKTQRAQLAAMFIAANNFARHGGWPTSAKFYSVEANLATERCLLGLGWNDPGVGWGYLYDFGINNVGGVGHRVSLLAPWTQLTVGLGNVPATGTSLEAQAFALDGSSAAPAFDPDGFICWPCAGYVPHYLVTGQWNADIPDKLTSVKWSFKAATITVLRNGVAMPITGGPRSASDGAVWTIDGLADGSSRYGWSTLSNGERVYGNPNETKDVVYHVILDGLRKRVTPPDDPGAPDQGGGELYQGTGRYEYDVIGYNPDLPTTMAVTTQPVSQTVVEGTSALLSVEATGVSSYQWFKDWVAIPGATEAWLQLASFKAADAGKYHVLMQGDSGALLSAYATLSHTPAAETAGKLVNVSTRSYVGEGDSVLVGGFVVAGTQAKMVLIRAAGPALQGLISQAELADPLLKLYDSRGQVIATNDDWCAEASRKALLLAASQQVRAFPFEQGSKDAVLLVTLQPGLYTAQVMGKPGQSGIALVEIYEVGSTGTSRMVNLSGRSMNAITGEPSVPGFVISGTQRRKVLIRAAGPALTGLVSTPMEDPELVLFNASGTQIGFNDDWSAEAVQAGLIEAAATLTEAFAWKRGSKDAALLVDLEPGLYTAHGRGKGGGTGISLVEIYEVP